MDVKQMRNCFDNKISAIIRNKRDDNKSFLNSHEYEARIENVKQSKFVLQTPGFKKNTKDYRIVSRYDVLSESGKERLIKPMNEATPNVVYFATNEELFDILHSAHLSIGHGGRNRMVTVLKRQYANITAETVMAYLELCTECRKKSSYKKELVSNPILQARFNSIVQSNRWTVNQVEALVDQYKKYPVLYDTNHKEYANAEFKSACVTNIVEALQTVRLGVTDVDVTSQWNNLMIKYIQATQVQQGQHSETVVNQDPQFWYLDKLKFLQEHLRSTEIKLDDCSTIQYDETNLLEPEITTETHEWRDGNDPLAPSFEIKEEIEDSPPRKKHKDEDSESSENETSLEDENVVFGKFVTTQLTKITDDEVRQDTIFEIHKVLYKALKKK